MAKAFSNPVPAPLFLDDDGKFNHSNYKNRCEQYRAETENYIRTELKGNGKHVGKIIRFPVADGYAVYMVWTPTKWIHLDEVDGYHADPALIRGMRAVDTLERLNRRALFS